MSPCITYLEQDQHLSAPALLWLFSLEPGEYSEKQLTYESNFYTLMAIEVNELLKLKSRSYKKKYRIDQKIENLRADSNREFILRKKTIHK